MTGNGGTNRPTAEAAGSTAPTQTEDTRVDTPSVENADNAASTDGSTTSSGETSGRKRGAASSAYEVAAALRSKADKGTKKAADDDPPPPPSNGATSTAGAEASRRDNVESTSKEQKTPRPQPVSDQRESTPDDASRQDQPTNERKSTHREKPFGAVAARVASAKANLTKPRRGSDNGAPTEPDVTRRAPSQRSRPEQPSSWTTDGTTTAVATPVAPPEPTGQLDAVDVGGAMQRASKPTRQRRPARMPQARRTVRVRKARLRLMRVDPWSVMKTAFLLSVALGITLLIAVVVLWAVLDSAGVFDSVRDIVIQFTATDSSRAVDINEYIELSRVLGFTTLIAVVDVVLVTALATLGAFLYNLSASLLGGLELTLAEDD